MEQRRQNYKSDFALRERFRNAAGDVVALPNVDFELRYWTRDPANVYTAKRDNGVMTNCMADGDAVLVLLQNHGLGEGELHHELHLKLDNIVFDGGVQNVYYPENMNILLWNGKSDTDGVLESDAIADYLSCETIQAKEAAEQATRETLAAKELAEQAAADAQNAQKLAEQATRDAQNAKEATDEAAGAARQATDDALAAKDAANGAAGEALEAKEQTEAATGEAQQATREALAAKGYTEQATRETIAAKDEAAAATQAARQTISETLQAKETAQQQNNYVKRTVDTLLEVMAIHSASPNSVLATGMVLSYPKQITLGNDIAFIRATVTPATIGQDVRFISDDVACEVDTGGNIRIKQKGSSRVHVIPAAAPQYFKTINIDVVAPCLRLTGGCLRLDGNGNIRFT